MWHEIKYPSGLFESGDRDEQENREVAVILAGLPRDHLACRAFVRGRATIEITNHLRDRLELFHKLMNVTWNHYRRTKLRRAGGRPEAHP